MELREFDFDIEDYKYIEHDGNDYVYHKGSVKVLMDDCIIERLEKYKDCKPLCEKYLEVLEYNIIHLPLASKKIMFNDNCLSIKPITIPTLETIDELDILTLDNVTVNASSPIRKIALKKLINVPYIFTPTNLYFPSNGTFINSLLTESCNMMELLTSFWNKSYFELDTVKIGVRENTKVQIKFMERLEDKFTLTDNITQVILDHNTDLQYMITLLATGLIKPKVNINV